MLNLIVVILGILNLVSMYRYYKARRIYATMIKALSKYTREMSSVSIFELGPKKESKEYRKDLH